MTNTAAGQFASFGSALVPATGDWTVEAWVRQDGAGFGTSGSTLWSQYYNTFSERLTASSSFSCPGGGSGCVGVLHGSATAIAAGGLWPDIWTHVVARRTGSGLGVYADGRLVAATVTSGDVDDDMTWIGGHYFNSTSNAYFNGSISQFAVYRESLSVGRIRAHYLAAGPPQQAPLGGPLLPEEYLGDGCSPERGREGDPVETQSGNFSHLFSDLSIPGRGLIGGFSRTYNSLAAGVDGPLGFGWTHCYAMGLDTGTSTVVVSQEGGSQATFDLVGSTWTPAPRVQATLVHNGNGTWTFTRRDRAIYGFDSTGRVISMEDLNGETTTIAYPSATSQVITDPAGRTVDVTLASGRIVEITDDAARTVEFGYDGNGDLVEVIDVEGGVTTFTYDGDHQLLTWRTPVRWRHHDVADARVDE